MDSSIVPLKKHGLFLVSTTDFFYPLVDDPYMQGKIACANVLSDLYAMGVVNCDNILMLLAVSRDMTPAERDVCTTLMMKGFNDLAVEAETEVTGGQTVLNPWPIIGGAAMSVCHESELRVPVHAQPGDVLVLTKPLGTQVAVNVHQWLHQPAKWAKLGDVLTPEEAEEAYQLAMVSMAHLNRSGAKLMHKYDAHAATDVTGFGILGHARNLAKNQLAAVRFEIDTLPIIANMKKASDAVDIFRLMQGFSAETSGGLLVCLPATAVEPFREELRRLDGTDSWVVGRVVPQSDSETENTAVIVDSPAVIEVAVWKQPSAGGQSAS